MNIWQSKLDAVCRKSEAGLKVRRVQPVEPPKEYKMRSYRVVKEFGGQIKRVAFGLTIRDAEIFAKAMPMKMQRVEHPTVEGDAFEKAEYKIEEE
jgi:hypothetical protein